MPLGVKIRCAIFPRAAGSRKRPGAHRDRLVGWPRRAPRLLRGQQSHAVCGSGCSTIAARGLVPARLVRLMRPRAMTERSAKKSTCLPDYAELHCISNFTFLRGASHPGRTGGAGAAARLRGAGHHRRMLGGRHRARARRCARSRSEAASSGAEFRLTRWDCIWCCWPAPAGLRRALRPDHAWTARRAQGRLSPGRDGSRRGLDDCLAIWLPAAGHDLPAAGRWLSRAFRSGHGSVSSCWPGRVMTARLAQLLEICAHLPACLRWRWATCTCTCAVAGRCRIRCPPSA